MFKTWAKYGEIKVRDNLDTPEETEDEDIEDDDEYSIENLD